MLTRSTAAFVVVASLFATGRTHADPTNDASMAVPEKARLLSDRGRQLQRDGKFADAIEAYKAAYVLAPSPGLLFNLAQAYRLNGNCEDAVWLYRRLLATDPREDLRALANEHLEKLSACKHDGMQADFAVQSSAKRTAQAEVPTSSFDTDPNHPETPDDEGHSKRRLGAYLMIGGSLSLVVATIFAIDGQLAANEVADAYASGVVHPDLQGLDDRGHRDDTITAVAGITGGAVLITGAVLYGLGRRDQAQHLAFEPHRDGGLVKVAWQF
jgi:tetratricopeptide (TPR) repeat protein